jgi:alcohol dehydrogenase class IV
VKFYTVTEEDQIIYGCLNMSVHFPSVYENKIDTLALHASNDPDTNVNPKRPLVKELVEIFRQAYKGI